jgi:DNA-binding protein HU-beta
MSDITMNRSSLSDKLAAAMNITKSSAADAVEHTFKIMKEHLTSKKGNVSIHDFGIFKLHTRGEHAARNPSTGEAIIAPEKTTVKFKPSTSVKTELNA